MSLHPDIFRDKKCIHIKLNKETHTALKILLFEKKMSMQEVFEEFAVHLVEQTSSGKKVLKSVSNKKMEAFLEGRKRLIRKSPEKMGDVDIDSLYDVISGMSGRGDFDEDD